MVRIAVIGCGLMGVKIAGEMAYHGHRVKLYDRDLTSLNSAYQRIEEDKLQLQADGLLVHRNFVGQMLCLSRLEETVRDAEFIFEAVLDELEIKQDLFERISHCCMPNAIIASNTLRCHMTTIVDRTVNKERTLGLRFLYPVYYIPEVEITPNQFTSAQTIEMVRCLLESMSKTLFFRSGGEPLILSEEQRDARKIARLEQISTSLGGIDHFESNIPTLAHRGNMTPRQDDEDASTTETERDCAICMDRVRDTLLCPCHHMVTCAECARSLLNRRDSCPICRKDITEVIKVYHS